MSIKATIIGSTGLIGSHLLNLIQEDDFFDEINIVVRRSVKVGHPKVKVVIINFNDLSQFEKAMQGSDIVFSAIGTTQKKVSGDKTVYRNIDFDITVNAAKFSSTSGCKHFLVVSSIGAVSSKKGFYLRLKGEIEDALINISKDANGFKSLSIFRPSLLLGNRSETRIAEGIGQFIGRALSFIFPSKYKPIEAKKVAEAMIEASKLNENGVKVYTYKSMKKLAQ